MLEIIRAEGGEPVLTDFTDFLLYCLMDQLFDWRHLGGCMGAAVGNWLFIQRIEHLRNAMRHAVASHPEGNLLLPVSRISDLGDRVNEVISTGNTAGEGWLLTADMLELVDCGATNVLCLQPFGCLPNHITGKGVIRELKRVRPQSNIMAVDYDPGASQTNQINRIKLFMSVAREQAARAAQRPGTPTAEPVPEQFGNRPGETGDAPAGRGRTRSVIRWPTGEKRQA